MSGYRYDGSARYYGVPARDLTQDEFDRLAPGRKRLVLDSPAYTPIAAKGLSDLRRAELDTLATERGIDPTEHSNRESLIAALSALDAASGDDGQED